MSEQEGVSRKTEIGEDGWRYIYEREWGEGGWTLIRCDSPAAIRAEKERGDE